MIIVDTGPLYAVSDRDDDDYEKCLDFFDTASGPFIVPQSVITETCWLIEDRLGAEYEARFLESFLDGQLVMEALIVSDVERIVELVRRYDNLPLGTVDASVIAIAERLRVSEIATLDHKDFLVVRPSHVDAFTLLP